MAQIGTPSPPLPLAGPAAPPALVQDWLGPLRSAVFLAALVLSWLSLKPFSDLAGSEPAPVNDAIA